MFKHFLVLASLSVGFGARAQAQPTAHQWLLTGGINLRSNTTSDDGNQNSNAGVSISPAVGYFLTDYFAVGLGGGLGAGQSESTRNYPDGVTRKVTQTNSFYSVNVFGRYYARLSDHTALTATLAPGLSRSRNKYEEEGTPYPNSYFGETKRQGWGVSLTPGFAWFPTSRISLDVTAGNLGYFRSKETNPNQPETTNSSWNASLSLLNLGVGASLFFGGGQ